MQGVAASGPCHPPLADQASDVAFALEFVIRTIEGVLVPWAGRD
jgi:hypothetical protein